MALYIVYYISSPKVLGVYRSRIWASAFTYASTWRHLSLEKSSPSSIDSLDVMNYCLSKSTHANNIISCTPLFTSSKKYKYLTYNWTTYFSGGPLETYIIPIWWHQWTQVPYLLIILQVAQRRNYNTILPLYILFLPKVIPMMWLQFPHSYYPQKVRFHFQRKNPNMNSHPLPNSNSASPCSFNSNYL